MTIGLVDEDAMHGKAMALRCPMTRIARCISPEHLSAGLYSSGEVFLARWVVTRRNSFPRNLAESRIASIK
ncbi:hypothetical protein [Paraburkholderia kirstenboschensis]|uniref:hypothetical protein n=1 Tax=Paraburkholderia kirstenboschensis TaxID=1245436 RepID=UPI000FFC90F7|nr:hypothetical protein [Paraburkholderia kirstenboschensis]